MKLAKSSLLFLMCFSISVNAQDSSNTDLVPIAEALKHLVDSTQNKSDLGRLPFRGTVVAIALSSNCNGFDDNAPIIRGCRGTEVITYIDGLPARNPKSIIYADRPKIEHLGLSARFENYQKND